MKITTKTCIFSEDYTLEEIFNFIFNPNLSVEVSELIKCFRRYRVYLVGISYLSNNRFSFAFSFPRKDFLMNFRKEFYLAISELPK